MKRRQFLIDLTADDEENQTKPIASADNNTTTINNPQSSSQLQYSRSHIETSPVNIVDISDQDEKEEPHHSRSHFPERKRTRKGPRWQPFYLNSIHGIDSKWNQNCLQFSDFFYEDSSNPLNEIIFFNYMMDLDWMISQVPTLITKNVLCLHGSTINKDFHLPTWHIAKVDMGIERYGTHHTKMIFGFYENGIRIIITTANFIPEDFHSLTQGTFIQDFPRRSSSTSSSTSTIPKTDFEITLIEYLQRISTSTSIANQRLSSIIQKLGNDYDFSDAQVILIPSVPGRHTTNRMKWGIGKLSSILEKYGYHRQENSQQWPLVMQYSSLGSMGKDGKFIDELGRSMISSSPSSSSASSSSIPTKMIQLVWPTVETVRNSLLGYESGNSLPCSYKNLFDIKNNTSGQQQQQQQQQRLIQGFQGRLYRWDGSPSGRQRATPHMKCYFRYHHHLSCSSQQQHQEIELSWFVLTSANLSQAAWGTWEKNGSQLYIKSYEMGLLYLPLAIRNSFRSFSCTPNHPLFGITHQTIDHSSIIVQDDAGDSGRDKKRMKSRFLLEKWNRLDEHDDGVDRLDDMDVNIVRFPIPFQIPPSIYSPENDDFPWAWDIPYQKLDSHGRKRIL